MKAVTTSNADLINYVNERAQLPEFNDKHDNRDLWVGMSHTRRFLRQMAMDLHIIEPEKSRPRDVNTELRDFAEGK